MPICWYDETRLVNWYRFRTKHSIMYGTFLIPIPPSFPEVYSPFYIRVLFLAHLLLSHTSSPASSSLSFIIFFLIFLLTNASSFLMTAGQLESAHVTSLIHLNMCTLARFIFLSYAFYTALQFYFHTYTSPVTKYSNYCSVNHPSCLYFVAYLSIQSSTFGYIRAKIRKRSDWFNVIYIYFPHLTLPVVPKVFYLHYIDLETSIFQFPTPLICL